MFVQATVFDERTPAMFGDAMVVWQGVGADQGCYILNGRFDIGTADEWVLATQPAPDVGISAWTSAEYPGGTPFMAETLHPACRFPFTEWQGPVLRAQASGDGFGTGIAFTTTKLPQWEPRNWTFPSASENPTCETSAISAQWYGDKWWTWNTGAGTVEWQGVYRRIPSGSIAMAVKFNDWTGAYTPVGGTGTPPACVWERMDDFSVQRHVGYYNADTGRYQLNRPGATEESTSGMQMLNLGILRMPGMSAAHSVLTPSGWDFEGADWNNPDPMDARYWMAVRYAIVERESMICEGDWEHDIGTLVPGEELLAAMGPLDPPAADAFAVYRRALLELSKRYADLSQVVGVLQADAAAVPDPLGTSEFTDIYRSSQTTNPLLPDLAYGSVRSDPAGSVNGAKEWLAAAKRALERMTLLPIPKTHLMYFLVPPPYGNQVYSDEGGTWATAYAGAKAKDFPPDYPPLWYTEGHWGGPLDPSVSHGFITGFRLFGLCENYSGNDYTWDAVGDRVGLDLSAVNIPSSSVLDGSPLAGVVVVGVHASKKSSDLASGDQYSYQGITGTVQSNTYYSDRWTEGVSVTTGGLGARLFDAWPASAPTAPTSTGPGDVGFVFHGNETHHWMYLWYGDAFKFGGPKPWEQPDPEEP